MEGVATNLQQQVAVSTASTAATAYTDGKRANSCSSGREREAAPQGQPAELTDLLNVGIAARLAMTVGTGRATEPRPRKAFIETIAFSKMSTFDSKAASRRDGAFKFENLATAVFTSSRDTYDRAAQQETAIVNVDDVEASPVSLEIYPQVFVALAELLEGEA